MYEPVRRDVDLELRRLSFSIHNWPVLIRRLRTIQYYFNKRRSGNGLRLHRAQCLRGFVSESVAEGLSKWLADTELEAQIFKLLGGKTALAQD